MKKVKSKKRIINKLLSIFIISILFSSCTTHHIHFDIEKQQLISCNSSSFLSLSINGINNNVSIKWKGNINETPHSLDLNNIPKGYDEIDGGIKRIKPFKLLPNSLYTISKDGMGRNPHYIRIWTDSKGKVYKTTHPNCDSGDGNDGVQADWVM